MHRPLLDRFRGDRCLPSERGSQAESWNMERPALEAGPPPPHVERPRVANPTALCSPRASLGPRGSETVHPRPSTSLSARVETLKSI